MSSEGLNGNDDTSSKEFYRAFVVIEVSTIIVTEREIDLACKMLVSANL